MRNSSRKAYEVIADRIISALNKGEVPWRKPWSLKPGMKPQSVSGRAYTGINVVILALSGYSDPRWLTYRKALELGGHVKKGEKSTPVVLWKPVEREVDNDDIETQTFWLLRCYSVFNIGQCEGLELPPLDTPQECDPIQAAEEIIAEMPNRPCIKHDGCDRAYYIPSKDEVHLPFTWDFDSMEEYYSTAFHELAHSTGHNSRLDRHEMESGLAPFGSPTYSREELVAEFCAAFLCNESGIENTIENSAAYIQSWAKVLDKDNRLVVVAASQGQKAANYVLNRQAA